MSNSPIEIFYCYSSEDEEIQLELVKHLASLRRQGTIKDWYFRKISAGTEWEKKIDDHLNKAKIILLLVSNSFIASDYCWDIEMKRAIERHESGTARVIPIILRPADWTGTPFHKLQALPKDAKPVTSWANRDDAFVDIAKGIRLVCEEIQEARSPIIEPHLNLLDEKKSQKFSSEGSTQTPGILLEKLKTITVCQRCGIRPGERSTCVGSHWEHDFRQYKGSVYCQRCGVKPGERTTCVGSYWEHDFRQYSKSVYCQRCGIKPGERTTCVGSYWEHDFRQYNEPVYCQRCGMRPGERSTCVGSHWEHFFVGSQ
jgi:hypothetical protein